LDASEFAVRAFEGFPSVDLLASLPTPLIVERFGTELTTEFPQIFMNNQMTLEGFLVTRP